jgi:hypothetical protein
MNRYKSPLVVLTFVFSLVYSLQVSAEDLRKSYLDEVTVTAQKRSESLQDAPIAISSVSAAQLDQQAITSIGSFVGGAIPSLRVIPLGSTPTNLVIGIRGNAPSDVSEVTRDGAVGIYGEMSEIFFSNVCPLFVGCPPVDSGWREQVDSEFIGLSMSTNPVESSSLSILSIKSSYLQCSFL